MDIAVQAMSGVMSATGFPDNPPVKAGVALCDFLLEYIYLAEL